MGNILYLALSTLAAISGLYSNKDVQSSPVLLAQVNSMYAAVMPLVSQALALPAETQLGSAPVSPIVISSPTSTDASSTPIVVTVNPPAQPTSTPALTYEDLVRRFPPPVLGIAAPKVKTKAPNPPYYLSAVERSYEDCSDDSSCVLGVKPTSTRIEFIVGLGANGAFERSQLGGLTKAELSIGSSTYQMNINGLNAKLLLDKSGFQKETNYEYSVYLETKDFYASSNNSDSFTISQ